MAKTSNKSTDQFQIRIVPIMNQVRDELCQLRAEEQRKHNSSLSVLFAGAAGPDGGMAATDVAKDRLQILGKWNNKTVDDYIKMVKAELAKQHIVVDAVKEKKMIDYLVQQQMPKSTIDYVLRKAAKDSIFYLPQRTNTTSLQNHIDKEGEKKHDPSLLEDAAGSVLSWMANAATTMGAGGFFGQAALDGATMATSHYAHGQQEKHIEEQKKIAKQEVTAASKKSVSIPKWMLSQMGFNKISNATDKQLAMAQKWANKNGKSYRHKVRQAVEAGERTVKSSGKTTQMSVSEATCRAMQYETFSKAISKELSARKLAGKDAVHYSNIEEADENASNAQMNSEAPSQTEESQKESDNVLSTNTGDYSGWDGILSALGMNGMGDMMQHLGFTLSMLPDMLLGAFTGRTKSVGLNQGTMMPLAALITGTFIKNPLIKIPLILFGGVNLVNKMGQEALAEQREENQAKVRYKHYDDEELNKRMKNPHIEGNVLLVDIDNIPRLVTLPQTVVEAYQAGALSINTIANRILAKTDQFTESNQREVRNVSEQYEQKQEREQVRGIR